MLGYLFRPFCIAFYIIFDSSTIAADTATVEPDNSSSFCMHPPVCHLAFLPSKGRRRHGGTVFPRLQNGLRSRTPTHPFSTCPLHHPHNTPTSTLLQQQFPGSSEVLSLLHYSTCTRIFQLVCIGIHLIVFIVIIVKPAAAAVPGNVPRYHYRKGFSYLHAAGSILIDLSYFPFAISFALALHWNWWDILHFIVFPFSPSLGGTARHDTWHDPISSPNLDEVGALYASLLLDFTLSPILGFFMAFGFRYPKHTASAFISPQYYPHPSNPDRRWASQQKLRLG
ncbi:hypothetical protein MKZ38_002306 [Zalerion maritima]|uniref:Uncharacterized protein n=1 Tax=Zalerion maritima TaxID=339359 RepID=A0AAD5RQN7_9PEZI|nr:hypothetical protein MKZ38_002306 [Zalerion maritima]